jgi:hypothetical protein
VKYGLCVYLVLGGLVSFAQVGLTVTDPQPGDSRLTGIVNMPYSLAFTAGGGSEPYTFSAFPLIPGSQISYTSSNCGMPPGLQISPTGVVSGTPLLPGAWCSNIYVQDSLGRPNPLLSNFIFTFNPSITFSPPTAVAATIPLNTPFQLGFIKASSPGAALQVTLTDPWIRFAVPQNPGTSCANTANNIPVTTGTAATPLIACLVPSNVPSAPIALIRATAAGYAPVADGLPVRVSSPNFQAADLSYGAMATAAALTGAAFSGPPSISYASADVDRLTEIDNCNGNSNCNVLLAAAPASSALQPGEQFAARLDFASTTGSVGSLVAKYRYLPSTISIAPSSFDGVYNWPFTATVTASGGAGQYTWSAAGLPQGLKISSDGVISGTPLQAGATSAFLTATDSLGYRTSQQVTFSFSQGAPALALVAANPISHLEDATPKLIVGTLSSSPTGATVQLTLAAQDFQYFGFPSANRADASCDHPTQSTSISTPAPQPIYVCVSYPIPTDGALLIYLHITATAPGWTPISVVLPLESIAVFQMQVTTPVDISATGSGNVAVAVVSNNPVAPGKLSTSLFDAPPWIKVAEANSNVPCAGRASCSFRVSADISQLSNPVAGQTFDGSVIFHADQGLSATVNVVYTYSGSPLTVTSTFFRSTLAQGFAKTASATGGTGVYTWSSPDLPGNLTISPDGTILGSVLTPGVTQAHLNVRDGANHSATAVVTFVALTKSVSVATDFDGDGRTDCGIWRPSTGTWFVVPSANPGAPRVVTWGVAGDKPVSGDFDGDGKTDYGVWRPSTATWFVIQSSNPRVPIVVTWGAAGDIPVAGDFDGDGKTDIAVWRPSTATWFVIPSSNPGAPIVVTWGGAGDVPVSADFDGDGKTDIAVWRPSTATWFVIQSSNPGVPIVVTWGAAGDIPVAADFDGDGKADIAIWRPSTGTWFVFPSANPAAPIVQPWGALGDVALTIAESSM